MLSQKRSINRREILGDIRSGMGDASLMEKYQLSPQQLQSVYRQLRERGDLETGTPARNGDLSSRANLAGTQVPEVRQGTRRELAYGEKLNPEQLRAVQSVKGPVLVIAGAGTGKTKTLVWRVAYLINQGVSPEAILLLTFTRRAAAEMISRAKAIIDHPCGEVSGGTFHSFANTVLRKHALVLGYSPRFSILDRSDSEDVVGRIRTEFVPDNLRKIFPPKKTIAKVLSKAVNTRRSIEDIITTDYPHLPECTKVLDQIAKRYTEYKRQRSMMDYDDLLVNLLALLTDHVDVRNELSQQYRYVMVDEYQDTNKLQAEIASQLSAAHRNIMVVGDDSQSIYSFRGADFHNIMAFPKHFPDSITITLEQNYRSTQPILDLTNAICANAREKFPKRLFSKKEGQEKPFYSETRTVNEQSQFVCKRVLQLREDGVQFHHMAVLFRSAYLSDDLEIELARAKIPFVKYGGIRFIEAAHVKDVLSYLRVTVNPSDEIAWHRLLTLLEGIGPRKAEDLIRDMMGSGHGLEVLVAASLRPKRIRELLHELHATLISLDSSKTDAAGAVKLAVQHYTPILERLHYDDYAPRLRDLGALEQISSRYEGVESFLTDMALEPPNSSQRGIKPSWNDEKPLVLSTIHSAKGLEWDTVFLISLVDGYLPPSYAVRTGQEDEIEEERRILYVAATRAKRHLFLMVPHVEIKPGNAALREPSRFLCEISDLGILTQKWSGRTRPWGS